jgi:hypothetical protein
MRELESWVEREVGDWDAPREDEVRFVMDVANFKG